jgi:arylsulfatase A-like enzyme
MRRIALALAFLTLFSAVHAEDAPQKFLIIVVDGLRPDYITPENMPALHRLGDAGVFFENHHAAIPTVTRVASSTFSTGSYPESHGIMGNSVYFPNVNRDKALNTSDYKNLTAIRDAEGGRLLTATTIGEALVAAGKKFVAVSSGSTGSAFLLNSTVSGGGVIHPDLILPESQATHVREVVGPQPEDAMPATGLMAWATDAYIKIARKEMDVEVAFLWLTDPDHTAHSQGMGAPLTVESLRAADTQIARILDAHEQLGVSHQVNILVTSDHGFSTHIGGHNLFGTLTREGLQGGVHIAGDAIYVDKHDKDRIRKIVEVLQREPGVGPIFTQAAAPNATEGWVPGTLALDVIHWQHARSADIFAPPNWDNEENEHGFAGRTTNGGVAGHGSTSRWDIHNTLIAYGPLFKTKLRTQVASANVDVAPTVLHALGIDAPASMTGRPLREALANGPDPASIATLPINYSVERTLQDADGRDFTYRCKFDGVQLENRLYVNSVSATR